MSDIVTRGELNSLLVCMNSTETDLQHYAQFYKEIMAHDAALRARVEAVERCNEGLLKANELYHSKVTDLTARLAAKEATIQEAVMLYQSRLDAMQACIDLQEKEES